jgi:hypothetical protein
MTQHTMPFLTVPETASPVPFPAPETQTGQLPAVRPAGSPLDLPEEVFQDGLQRRQSNRSALMVWIREALVEGTDYGCIHTVSKDRCQHARNGNVGACENPSHWSKPNLFKPGAEKICGMLGVTPSFPTLAAYEEAALHGIDIKAIVLRCEILDGEGRIVGSGVGARTVQKDYGDLNKALKMAAKSAHIDATLRLGGLSEVFTQDLEDLPDRQDATSPVQPQPKAHTNRADKPTTPGEPPKPRMHKADAEVLSRRARSVLKRAKESLAFEAARDYANQHFSGTELTAVLDELKRLQQQVIAGEKSPAAAAGRAEPPKRVDATARA